MSKGIIELILEQGGGIEYEPISIEEMATLAIKLHEQYKCRKGEYLLSRSEAETLPLYILTWLGNNYTVLCSLEVANIVKERESKEIK